MIENIEETRVPRAVPNKLRYPFHRSEASLKATLDSIYPDGCDVDLRRWLSDFQPTQASLVSQTEKKVDCPVAAAVYTRTTRIVLAIVVFFDEVTEDEIRSARELCHAHGVRFFPVERLDSYPADILERSTLCEEVGLGPEYLPHIIPAARCPNCDGPLIHKTRNPTRLRSGLFYACAQYIGSTFACCGFLCGAEEIFEHLNPRYRDLKYRIQTDVEAALGESDWA
jgi:hypothetical protein